MKEFGKLIYRKETKAYIINDGNYTVPHPDDTTVPESIREEFRELYKEIDEYAAAHKENVTTETPHVPTLEELKAAKLSEINSKYNAATSSLVSTYPQTELLTFDKQESEARAWTADNSAETPLVDMLAAGRQIDKAELARRIIAKADAFALATGYLTGQRQRYEDLLGEAQTVEAVEAIVPEYKMPEA